MRCKSARFRLGVMAVLVMTFDIISAISVDGKCAKHKQYLLISHLFIVKLNSRCQRA